MSMTSSRWLENIRYHNFHGDPLLNVVSRMRRERVVITGLSAITCIGPSAEKFWSALIEGKTGASLVEGLPFKPYSTNVAC